MEHGAAHERSVPLGIAHTAVDAARAQPRGEGYDRLVAAQRLLVAQGIVAALPPVQVYGQPYRVERTYLAQQIVHDYAHIPETVDHGCGQHHAVQTAEGVVRREDIAAVGGQAVEPLDRIVDTYGPKETVQKLRCRQLGMVCDVVVEPVDAKSLFESMHGYRRQHRGHARRTPAQQIADRNFQCLSHKAD